MTRLPLALLAVSALAACATTGEGSSQDVAAAAAPAPRTVDRAARENIVRQDMLTQMAFWAGEYQTFPNDLEAAQRLADALRRGGRADRAAQIAAEALNRFPEDRSLMTTYGYAQIASNRPHEALRPLALVAQAEPDNWRVRSALGAALDQLGRFAEARRAYQEALALEPNNARVLTNLGVSHIMAGEPADAERYLRQAAEQRGAPPETRQNLAIALALQGRFDEAEQIERVDLPPAQAAENMRYLRSLLSDPRRWNAVRGREG
ncbi:MAG TPA: tetratricopeptide repeat protein [Vitreimonas sp.]|nr:tetratricopeptide repeat protein [Vitreimonas sp.]